MVRSAPAQNVSFPDVTTAPLIAASEATCSTTAASSSITLRSMTFIERPGESQVTSAMPSMSVSSLKWTICMIQVPGSGLVRIRLAGSAQEAHPLLVAFHHQIDVRIVRALGRRARADLEIACIMMRAVDELVAVRHAGLEARAIAGLQHDLALVLDQHQFAFEHIDEFVFLLVPVAQRGGRAGL